MGLVGLTRRVGALRLIPTDNLIRILRSGLKQGMSFHKTLSGTKGLPLLKLSQYLYATRVPTWKYLQVVRFATMDLASPHTNTSLKELIINIQLT